MFIAAFDGKRQILPVCRQQSGYNFRKPYKILLVFINILTNRTYELKAVKTGLSPILYIILQLANGTASKQEEENLRIMI